MLRDSRHAFSGLLLVISVLAVLHGRAHADSYIWRNVTVGGGGFSPRIVFSRVEPGLAYLRTDIGGVYRWDRAARSWRPLQDSMTESNYFGVESVAADPRDANVVYAAVGMYRHFPAAILRSSNRGEQWEVIPVGFRMGGNEPSRGLGERLAIDPNSTNVLYFGSRYDGLQRSVDSGRTWSKVASFPAASTAGTNLGSKPGISFVLFDASSGSAGSRSQTILAGVAEPGAAHLFVSNDAGEHWTALPDQPRSDLLPMQGEIDRNDILYVTYSNGTGPNGITDGAVFKFDLRAQRWTDITPEVPTAQSPGGYMGLSIDAQRSGTLIVATMNRWHPGDVLWRTTNGGTSWTRIDEMSERDVAATPFLSWGETHVPFGWWMAGVAIDPFNSKHVAYTTGATIYATHELDDRRRIRWRTWVEGVEETAIITLASPPSGPPLFSGFGDIGGFAHEDFDRSPAMFTNPAFDNTNIVDFAGRAPNIVIRSGAPHRLAPDSHSKVHSAAWSSDSGKTWSPLHLPAREEQRFEMTRGLPIAVTADGASFIAMTPVPYITRDRGKSWTAVRGAPSYARIVADREDPALLYALDADERAVFISTNGGVSFTEQPTSGLPEELRNHLPRSIEAQWPLLATPGQARELWFLSAGRLYRSVDAGRSFARIKSDLAVQALAFGKAAPDKEHPTLFAIGTRRDVRAIWRSDDLGQSWQRINNDRHEYGRRFRCIAGDPRIYGRVYVGTDGRGIIYGDLNTEGDPAHQLSATAEKQE